MSVDLNSFVWASSGIEPWNEEDAIYRAGDQPIAGYDNFIMWAVTTDIESVRDHTVSHGTEHESEGPQEINLNDLSVGTAIALHADGDQFSFQSSGQDLWRIDTDKERILDVPEYGTQTVHREGIELRNDVVRHDGDVIYDYSDDRFHRAERATRANIADHAEDSDLLDGHGPDAFIREEDAEVNPTGEWEFDERIDADIDGHATSATYATRAGAADDADLLDGNGPDYYAKLPEDESVSGKWGFEDTVDLEGSSGSSPFVDFTDPTADDNLVAESLEDGDWWSLTPRIDGSASDNKFYFDYTADRWNVAEELYVDDSRVINEEYLDDIGGDFFDPADNYTITGEWEFTKPIIGDITGEASWADDAGHADTADEADEADWAAEADHAEEADWAQEAEYTNNSDKVDGYHADDLKDWLLERVDTGDNGRWVYIDEWTVGDGSSSVEWEYDVLDDYDDPWDLYNLVVVHENASSWGSKKFLDLNLNFDFRYRYSFAKTVHNSEFSLDFDLDFGLNIDIEKSWGRWPICPTPQEDRTMAEYKIAAPSPMTDNVKNKPMIAVDRYQTNTETDEVLQWGELDTDFDDVHAFSLESSGPSAVYVQLWGSNLY